ncbi:urease subunit gamma [Streptomyces albospinus]|uniref:Urease subunit gamma n=1 Tax=Streptomyces albospinus TaxID=285515 RepID=A0ABQ2VGK7_9ACTN|nr:urease subunit gamma [Streptomyces albospinus]GGU84360.1 urease subunit gamma [Streptomyces albospinus]
MNLAPLEIDRLCDHVVADPAHRRRARGVTRNYSEAVAPISEGILEAVRDGRTIAAEYRELGKKIVAAEDVMPGTCDKRPPLQIEAAFMDGTKLILCHVPIGA